MSAAARQWGRQLNAAELLHVRGALAFLKAQSGAPWFVLARALRAQRRTLRRVSRGGPAKLSLAGCVARLVGVSLTDVLAGRAVPAGICPHCGRTIERAQ